jgi:dTDP-4-dehydrorhamnose reductase
LKKNDGTILDEMAMKLVNGMQLIEAHDYQFCPMLIDELVPIITYLQAMKITGLINVCGNETWSRFDLAQELAKRMNIPLNKITKKGINDIDTAALRPLNTSMMQRRLQSIATFHQTSIRDCIQIKADQWKL